MHFITAVALVALLIAVPAGAGAGPDTKPKPIQYLYGTPKPIPAGQETELTVTCPKGTFAVSAGFAQFDDATEGGVSDPGVIPVFVGVVSAGKPGEKTSDARIASVILRNTGSKTTIMANARAVCTPARAARLVTGVPR